MNDLINRQMVMIDVLKVDAELLRRVLDDADVVGVEREKYEWGLGLIESYIYGIEHMSLAQQWIPCSERLPEDKKAVYWVCNDNGYQFECRWTNNVYGLGESDRWEWSIFDIPQYSKVVAWMPLPEPYKERSEE